MARQPLVVVLLTVPYKLAVFSKQHTAKLILNLFQSILAILLFGLNFAHFRNGAFQLCISGSLKISVLSVLVYKILYYFILGLSKLYYPEHAYLSVLLLVAEIILTCYTLKKCWNSALQNHKEDLKILVKLGFKDFSSFVLTLLTVLTIAGLQNLKNSPMNPDEYHEFIKAEFKSRIINIVELPFTAALLLFP